MGSKALRLVAECYANHCIAERVGKIILGRHGSGYREVKVVHKRVMGRDRILKDVVRIRRRYVSDDIVIVIDYEKGVSRKYVENRFNIVKSFSEGIHVGVDNRDRVVAVIFDPNIEEGFLCKLDSELCRSRDRYSRIKSREACSVLSRYLRAQAFSEVIRSVASEILSLLAGAHPRSSDS